MITIITVKLFFILSTLIIINFAAFYELYYNDYVAIFTPSKNLVGNILHFICVLSITEVILFVIYSVLTWLKFMFSSFSSQFSHIFFSPDENEIITILLVLILIFYMILIFCGLTDIFDLLMPFFGTFAYIIYVIKNAINDYKSKKSEKENERIEQEYKKIYHGLLDFDTAIDNMAIFSDEGIKLLSTINNDLIPKYNQLIELSRRADKLDSDDVLIQLEDNREKLQAKIKKLALTIKNCELEEDRNRLKREANLLIKSLD